MIGTNPQFAVPQPASMSATQLLTLTESEFSAIAALARKEFGLELGKGKEQLVAARLGKLTRRLGFGSFKDYYRSLLGDRSGDALVELIDALTTNHTSFFREPAHFDFLVKHVLSDQNFGRHLRIWSAASSTGEEPYSIAFMAREHLGAGSANLPSILATDISTRALETARKGMYRADRFQAGIPSWLRKHILRGESRWAGWYRIRPEIAAMVDFRRVNLIDALPDVGRFGVIFCRNVMIYFGRTTQEQVVERLAACLEPGGYLFIGLSESLTGMNHGLEQIQPAIYRKRGGKR
jgi:chemotaxis protein methyltransferase CheR